MVEKMRKIVDRLFLVYIIKKKAFLRTVQAIIESIESAFEYIQYSISGRKT